MTTKPPRKIVTEWIHIAFDETSSFVETYGFSGSQGTVNLEGLLLKPQGDSSRTLLVFMHPASTLQLLPMPRKLAQMGFHVLCAGSRFAKNDTALIMEKVVLDLGAYIKEAKHNRGYEKVVLMGWSGGGALSAFYQAQAEHPSITNTPAGDPVDIAGAGLIPADAVVFQAAHLSRARMLSEMIDPSVKNESDPDDRVLEMDIYDPRNPNQPPYSKAFIEEYRTNQLKRIRKIRQWVLETLDDLKRRNTLEMERGFVTHRTMAEPRFLDSTLDPNGRRPGWCYMGHPETANNGPIGLGRFSTLRSWLSQWSINDSNADGLSCAAHISKPALVVENEADDAVPQPHPGMMFDALGSQDKTMHVIAGATHYYKGQPEHLNQAAAILTSWMASRKLIDF
ncbi:alpha/beta hydrolase [Pusillimonas sp. DMV24BSW_D]|uniref:alpha/beta hydrolase n=1 Tax=Neopusillimonas aestuarii TaxID=2716226 RepID=UPI00140A6897|nr:alpha/beta hydrolase [Pusillimonas sp. DMV24BSW_D]QIM47891.1 alpha/beta hydrolase [Pusillimonas sp. DMV24BSW_D]